AGCARRRTLQVPQGDGGNQERRFRTAETRAGRKRMTDSDATLRAWAAKGIDASALAALTRDLPATQLWSLLLTVAEQRASMRQPAGLLQQYERDRFLLTSPIDQRTQLEFDRHLFDVAKAFEAIELAPLAPLGACSVLAPTSQNRVVAT